MLLKLFPTIIANVVNRKISNIKPSVDGLNFRNILSSKEYGASPSNFKT